MTENNRELLLKALIDVGQELASTVDLDLLLERILHSARAVFGFENAIIRLLDEDGQTLITAAAYGYPRETMVLPLTVGRGVMGQVAATREPLLVTEVADNPDYLPGIPGARSELAVPMLVGERLIGVFNLESPRPGAFSADDIPPLLTLAGQAAIAIENARLYRNLKTVSDRYQRLHQLNESILESASIGIYTVNTDMVITSWNRKMEEFSGVDVQEALGRRVLELFPGLEKEGFMERLRRVLTLGLPEKLRLYHRNLRGEVRFQKRRINPLLEKDTIAGAVVLVEDVTEFKQLLEQTIQSEKLAEVGKLSAALAHEVNNPLSVILYASQLLQREADLSTFQQELLDRIENETERLQTLTGSLLAFSRQGGISRRLCSVNDGLGEVMRLLHYEFSRKGRMLVEEYAELPVIEADINQLKQVWINLAMNALQALPPGGTLTVTSGVSSERNAVEILFADDGPGIPEPIRARIFEPFFTTKGEGEGTGLGLYVCRTIVQEHGGELTATSPPGGGALFRIVLPLIELPATHAESNLDA